MDWRQIGISAGIVSGVAIGTAFLLSLIIGLATIGGLRATIDRVGDVPGFAGLSTEWVVGLTLGQIFGAPLGVTINLFAEFQATATSRPLTLTVIVAVAAVLASVRCKNRGLSGDRATMLIQALAAGLLGAIGLAIIVALCTSITPISGLTIGIPIAALQAFVLISAAHAVGSLVGQGPPVSAKRPIFRTDQGRPQWLSDLGTLSLGYLAAAVIITVGLVIQLIVSSSGSDGGSAPADSEDGALAFTISVIAWIIAYLGNVLGGLLTIAQFSAVRMEFGVGELTPFAVESGSIGIFGSFSSGWLWLMPLALLLCLIPVALRIGLSRPPKLPLASAVTWRLPVAWAGGWLLLQFLISINARGNVDAGLAAAGGTAVTIGPSAFTFLAAGLWAFAVEIASRYLPGLAVTFAPGVAHRLGGRQAHRGWFGESPAGPRDPALAPASTSPASVGNLQQPGHTPGASEHSADPSLHVYQPMSPERKKRTARILGGVGVGAVVVIGGVVAVSAINASRGPEAAAGHYVQLIADGNATAANELVPPETGEGAQGLLTDEVLGSAVSRIEGIRTSSAIELDDDTATVPVEYSLGPESFQTELTVVREGRDLGIFDRWRVVSPMTGTVDVIAPAPASLSGIEIPVSSPESEGAPASVAYPGVYSVVPGEIDLYAAPEPQDLVVSTDSENYGSFDPYSSEQPPSLAYFEYEPTPELAAEVNRQVNDWLQECLEQGPPEQTDYSDPCEYGGDDVGGWFQVSDVSWETLTPPEMVESNPDDFAAGPGSVVFTGAAEVEATYTEDFFGGEETETSGFEVDISVITGPSVFDLEVNNIEASWMSTF